MIFVERLDEIREELQEYFGQINQVRMQASSKIPTKPMYLIEFEQCRKLQIPLVSGGIMDQPHLWLIESEVIGQVVELFETLDAIDQAKRRTQNAV